MPNEPNKIASTAAIVLSFFCSIIHVFIFEINNVNAKMQIIIETSVKNNKKSCKNISLQ